MKPLPKNYEHKEAEPRLQARWEKEQVYAWRNDLPREQSFVIDTPPPTVSGVLHMGHIFSYTQADFVARYQRMAGRDVFYPMGFDDNGLPTERLVEKIKGKKASQYPSREEFVKDCREVVKSAEDEFRELFKSVALSVDWKQEYQTVSDEVRKLSQESFLDLLKKGEAYRDFRPTYWDWVDQTAIAQAEIENKEMPGVMNEIAFTLESTDEDFLQNHEIIKIATTRPELLGACVAVMYHPQDPNAANYKDKTAITPVFGVKVPMIADELVERDKGTGLVMCCTFGDDTDKEWWRKHQLPMRPVLREDGKMRVEDIKNNDNISIGVQFQAARDGAKQKANLDESNTLDIIRTRAIFAQLEGLKPKQANTKILEMLAIEEQLLKQTNITHTVKCAERSGTPIEIIPTYQWFVKITDKKEALTTKGAECRWFPEFMQIRLNQWIEGLKEDWCISRQRFFGVPFPVWYSKRAGEEGKILLADTLPVDPLVDLPKGYKREEVVGDKDVMDTWATSSISPQISAKSLVPNKLFPADLRPQAHEIIRTWAFYTIVKAYLHANTIPWKNLMISGWCLASDKTKMSKSKGNVVTPVDLIKEKGADVVRYWASTSRLGADTAFSEDLLKIGKKLLTKLWNATSFSAIHVNKLNGKPTTALADMAAGKITETLDKWILTRLHKTVAKATLEFERFEYCDARVAVEEFFWKDFCDNYLELVKARAYGEIGDTKSQGSAHLTLYYCLDAILRLFAPFMPHITEELHSHIFEGNSIHARGSWPKAADYPVDEAAQSAGLLCLEVLEVVRAFKSDRKVSIKTPIKTLILSSAAEVANKNRNWIELVIDDLKSAASAESYEWRDHNEGNVLPTASGYLRVGFDMGEQADVA